MTADPYLCAIHLLERLGRTPDVIAARLIGLGIRAGAGGTADNPIVHYLRLIGFRPGMANVPTHGYDADHRWTRLGPYCCDSYNGMELGICHQGTHQYRFFAYAAHPRLLTVQEFMTRHQRGGFKELHR